MTTAKNQTKNETVFSSVEFQFPFSANAIQNQKTTLECIATTEDSQKQSHEC